MVVVVTMLEVGVEAGTTTFLAPLPRARQEALSYSSTAELM